MFVIYLALPGRGLACIHGRWEVGRVDSSVLAVVIGGINVDLHLSLPRLPRSGETVLGGDLRRLPGGKGGNQAAAMSALGARVRLVGAVGDDSAADWSRQQLEIQGVDTSLVRTAPAATGTAFVLVDSFGDNMITVAPGANLEMSPDAVAEVAPSIVAADVVVASLEVPSEVVQAAIDLCRSDGTRFILNAAPWHDGLHASLVSGCDALVVNQAEFGAIAVDNDPVRTAHALGIDTLVVTLGSDGALVADNRTVLSVPAATTDVVDTSGAGDCFTAAFAVALAEGADPVGAARFAVAAASLSVRRPGGRTAPRRQEVQALLGSEAHSPTCATPNDPLLDAVDATKGTVACALRVLHGLFVASTGGRMSSTTETSSTCPRTPHLWS